MYCIVELFMSMPQSKLHSGGMEAHQDAAVITKVCIEDGLPLLMASDIFQDNFFSINTKILAVKVFPLWHFQFPNEINELYVHTRLYENL